ncbi:hypothetical protein CFD26_106037 [Aspergillus turcosus]|uniref:Uncharacterized protein n=1 Tax=Aspergillus turcosus TaxID=1245748 RepID=A0A3R7IHI1_9EURO|nr:hypothetical protein CFD26_106037 [Aspergillus turcosus]
MAPCSAEKQAIPDVHTPSNKKPERNTRWFLPPPSHGIQVQQRSGRNNPVEFSEMARPNVPATDQAVYGGYKDKWAALPDSTDAWLARARKMAEVVAQDAPQRDQDNKSPRGEVALLKPSGLLKPLEPKKSIGMLVGYQLFWSTTTNVVRTAEQADPASTSASPLAPSIRSQVYYHVHALLALRWGQQEAATYEFHILEWYGNFVAHLREKHWQTERAIDFQLCTSVILGL